jgi:hypothetical protein
MEIFMYTTTRIKVGYNSIDGSRDVKTYALIEAARTFAHHWVGPHPEIGRGYAVSGDGIGKITVSGASLADLFPDRA